MEKYEEFRVRNGDSKLEPRKGRYRDAKHYIVSFGSKENEEERWEEKERETEFVDGINCVITDAVDKRKENNVSLFVGTERCLKKQKELYTKRERGGDCWQDGRWEDSPLLFK